MKPWSLRKHLTLIFGFAMTLALVCGGVAMYWAEDIEDDQMIDARLEQLGSTVLALVDAGVIESTQASFGGVQHLKTRPAAALLYRIQVWTRDGTLLLRSHEAPADRPIVDLQRLGFQTALIEGEQYRVLALPTRNHGVIQVAECLSETTLERGTVPAYFVAFLLFPFAAVFGVSWLLTLRSLRAINSLASKLQRRNPLDVRSLEIEDPPQEVVPILDALDSLFARAGRALSAERRFTSVAAHEMRTPLAGLRAQAQLAMHSRDEKESERALTAIANGVDRVGQMIEQLLDLARVEGLPEDISPLAGPVKLENVFYDVMHGLESQLVPKSISVQARFAVAELICVEFGLQLLLRNLLANAILYSPNSGRIEISSMRLPTGIALIIDDSGPGIPVHERDRAFERFNRLGRNMADGVGLGLSIVLLVVEIHRAKIQLLDSPLGGLRVQVWFDSCEVPSLQPNLVRAHT